MKYCPHNFLITPQDVNRQSSADYAVHGPLSPFCVDCWNKQSRDIPAQYKSEVRKPYLYGFCDLISQIARKRGFYRDVAAREDIENDFRLHLIQKQTAIERGIREEAAEQGIDPADPELIRNYIRRALQNFLTDQQAKSSAGKVIRNTVKSLSPEGLPVVTRK